MREEFLSIGKSQRISGAFLYTSKRYSTCKGSLSGAVAEAMEKGDVWGSATLGGSDVESRFHEKSA